MNILFAKEAFALPVTLPLFCFKPVYPTPVARAHTHTHTHTPGFSTKRWVTEQVRMFVQTSYPRVLRVAWLCACAQGLASICFCKGHWNEVL